MASPFNNIRIVFLLTEKSNQMIDVAGNTDRNRNIFELTNCAGLYVFQ